MSKIVEKSVLTFLNSELPIEKIEEDLEVILIEISKLLPTKPSHYHLNRYFESGRWDLNIYYSEDTFQKVLLIVYSDDSFTVDIV